MIDPRHEEIYNLIQENNALWEKIQATPYLGFDGEKKVPCPCGGEIVVKRKNDVITAYCEKCGYRL